MNEREARRFREHQALEKGVAFDPKSATGPLTIYLIKPTGGLLNHIHDWNPHGERVPLAASVAPPGFRRRCRSSSRGGGSSTSTYPPGR